MSLNSNGIYYWFLSKYFMRKVEVKKNWKVENFRNFQNFDERLMTRSYFSIHSETFNFDKVNKIKAKKWKLIYYFSSFDAFALESSVKLCKLTTWQLEKLEKQKRRRKSKILFYFQILPGLESFCAYCAIGIGAIYLFQCSWFVAWLSLDQRRIEARRDGLIPCCLVHKDWNPSTHRNQDNWTRNAFTYFANLVKNKIFKVSKPLTYFLHNDPDIHILSKNEFSRNFFSFNFFLYNFRMEFYLFDAY